MVLARNNLKEYKIDTRTTGDDRVSYVIQSFPNLQRFLNKNGNIETIQGKTQSTFEGTYGGRQIKVVYDPTGNIVRLDNIVNAGGDVANS
jgi:hypothetical protein